MKSTHWLLILFNTVLSHALFIKAQNPKSKIVNPK